MNYTEGAEEVRIIKCTNVRLGRLLDRANQAVTGVVDDNVQFSEMSVSLCNHLFDLFRVGYVECQQKNGVAEALRKVGDVCHGAGSRCNLIAA